VNSLPKTVTRQCRGCDLNPGPSAPESSTLTTWLPSHPCCLGLGIWLDRGRDRCKGGVVRWSAWYRLLRLMITTRKQLAVIADVKTVHQPTGGGIHKRWTSRNSFYPASRSYRFQLDNKRITGRPLYGTLHTAYSPFPRKR